MMAILASGPLAACERTSGGHGGPIYEGVETEVMEDGLVAVRAALRGAEDDGAVTRNADCGISGLAQARGFGFARHIRTRVDQARGRWTADAVYTVTAALPAGLRTIDAEVTAAECGRAGIPAV